MSTYERLNDNASENANPINHDDTVIPIGGGSESPRRPPRKGCGKTGMAFCGGGLSGFMIAVVVCSIVFGVVGFAYVKYFGDGSNGNGDSGMVGKGQVKEGATGKVFDTRVYDEDTEYSLLGVGRREKKIGPIKINVYAVGFYLHTEKGQAALLPYKDTSPDQLRASDKFYGVLRNADIPRHIRIIMSTNMVNKAKMQDGLKEALVPAIHNHVDPEKDGDPDAVANDKAHKLADLFDSDPKDNHVFDFTCDGNGRLIAVMNKKVKDPMEEPLICAGFTDVFVGPNSVSPTLKEDVAGRLNIIYDEGDNADIQEPTTELKFKEFLKVTPSGASEPEELKITGTAGMTVVPNPVVTFKKDLAFAMYSNWFEAQSQLVEKYSDSQEKLGNRADFRDDLLKGPWGRAVVIRLVADDFTKKELKDPYMKAFQASQAALGISEEHMAKANEDVLGVMDQLTDKMKGGAGLTFYCDTEGNLMTSFAGLGDDVIKNKITFGDAKSCSAALHAWAGSKSILPKLRNVRSINWDNLGSEIVWDQEVLTAAGINFNQVRKTTNNKFVQFIGGAEQVHSGWVQNARSVIGLYVSTNAATGDLKDLETVKPDQLSEPNNLKKIILGKFDRSLEFVQAPTSFGRYAETNELINQDTTKSILKRLTDDSDVIKAAEADLSKLSEYKTKEEFARVRVECDSNNKMTAIHIPPKGEAKTIVTSDVAQLCEAMMIANVAENGHLKAPIPDPAVFYGLWTATK